MGWIGTDIEKRRLALGLSRAAFGKKVGVSTQTILNVERDRNHNLGLRLLEAMASALNMHLDINLREKIMSTKIKMGNDEFILYIRKNYPKCDTTNDQLGKSIWIALREMDVTKAMDGVRQACLWGDSASNVHETMLPSTATQFAFDRSVLPAIYELLDSLGQQS